ncbi:alpha/beta fold hydrolase [Hydrogenophaga sp. 2FB]|uniref:alpha/beta fold hydrolase n=1 Tax=Hydrogenophaga sp. 2FB TaxID=2502187 RepID=UPI00207B9FF3|nr:alpha/beta fold hydrolase [Hydrogenophaga sp. 2FB]
MPLLQATRRWSIIKGVHALAPSFPSDTSRHETPCGDGVMVWRRWGEGEPVLLLHGGSGSWTHWLRNIDTIVDAGRSAWIPDLPNFGDSASLGDQADADAVVAPLLQGMEVLLGRASRDMVAFSFGSLVASLLAAAHPDRVRRLLLVGPPVLPLRSGKGVALRPWQHLSSAAEQADVHRANLAAIMFHDPCAIDAHTVALQAANAARDRMRRRRLVTTDAFARALAHIGCDTSAVFGAQDTLYRDAWPSVRAVLDACPGFRGMTLVPDAGHWVQYEAASACNQILRQWLSASPPAPVHP